MTHHIALLPGDGVGNDVMDAAKIVLDAIGLDAEYTEGDVGWQFWVEEGDALPQRTVELLEHTDCCLFGAITSKPKDEATGELKPELRGKGYVYSSPIVGLRQRFQLYANMRPCKAYPGNPLNHRDDIDLVVFRENTEGLYSGVEFSPVPDAVRTSLECHPKMKLFEGVKNEEIAISLRIFTKRGCRRIVKKAFEYAREHDRKSVTVVEKPNVIRETSGMMIDQAKVVAADYPEIELQFANVDAMAMWLIKNPERYGVIATSNMFGDIISDEAGQLVGGLGFASSANLGDRYAVFEPTHGSAPKYAGQHRVNPTAMISSVKLMLDWLGERSKAKLLDDAIASVIREGKTRTYDMGGSAGTLDVAEAVTKAL